MEQAKLDRDEIVALFDQESAITLQMLKLSEELWVVLLLAEDLANGLCLRRGKILCTTITR